MTNKFEQLVKDSMAKYPYMLWDEKNFIWFVGTEFSVLYEERAKYERIADHSKTCPENSIFIGESWMDTHARCGKAFPDGRKS